MNEPPQAHSPACVLCHRLFTPDSDEIQPIPLPICGDCKFLLLDDHGSPLQEDYRAMIHRLRGGGGVGATAAATSGRMRRRFFGSSESIGRQIPGYDDSDYSIYRGGSRRLRRSAGVLSDTETDSFFGESESNFSFSSSRFLHDEDDSIFAGEEVGWDDDALLGNESGENESDHDINPMRAALYRWNSRGDELEEEEYGVWRESDNYVAGGEDYSGSSPRNFVGFHELLEHLAEAEGSRRGAPPAAISFVRELPHLVVTQDHLGCAICKDPLPIGDVANQLPCSHLYHPSCILPWLSSRNSCPLCRYELPTDDKDYEDRKLMNEIRAQQHQRAVVNVSSEEEEEEEEEEEPDAPETEREGERERGAGTRGWILLAAAAAAAPVVGAVLMFCFGSPDRRWRTNFSGTGRHQTRCFPLRGDRGWGFLF